MMLKIRFISKNYLKMVFGAVVMCGTMSAFAQSENTSDEYFSLKRYFDIQRERCQPHDYQTGRITSLVVDTLNQVFINGKLTELDGLKCVIEEDLSTAWDKSNRKEIQSVVYTFARNSHIDTKTSVLKAVKDAYEEICAKQTCDTGRTDKTYSNCAFPLFVCEYSE